MEPSKYLVTNVALVTNAGALRARFDLDIVVNPAAELAEPGSGTLRTYRNGYFRKEDGTTFVGGPSFNKDQGKSPEDVAAAAAEGKKGGYIRALSFARADNAHITALVEAAIRSAVAESIG